MPEFSDHHHSIADNLKFLFKNLGVAELFERVDALDGKGGAPVDPPFNPTDNPMVQRNLEGVGTPSGGPNSENTGTLDVLEPERMEAIRQAAAEEKKTSSSSKSTRSTTNK